MCIENRNRCKVNDFLANKQIIKQNKCPTEDTYSTMIMKQLRKRSFSCSRISLRLRSEEPFLQTYMRQSLETYTS